MNRVISTALAMNNYNSMEDNHTVELRSLRVLGGKMSRIMIIRTIIIIDYNLQVSTI